METPTAPPNTERVLAVDDSAEMLILVQASVERHGYRVHPVDCGEAAIAVACTQAFDLIILDVDMPGLDGMAVGRALRANPLTRGAMIAMHTSLDEARVRLGFDGYDLFLPKPCCPVQLGERVDRLLQRTRVRRRSISAVERAA